MGVLYPEPPLNFPHQLMINTRFLLLMTNEDGLRTMVTNKRLAGVLHKVRKRRAIDLEVAGSGPVNCCFCHSLLFVIATTPNQQPASHTYYSFNSFATKLSTTDNGVVASPIISVEGRHVTHYGADPRVHMSTEAKPRLIYIPIFWQSTNSIMR